MSDLISTLQDRQQQYAADYAALVMAIADATPVDAERAEVILRNSDKSPEDLSHDVSTENRYRELTAQRAEITAALAELPGLRQKIIDSKSLADAALLEHHIRCRPWQVRIADINGLAVQGAEVDRALRTINRRYIVAE